MPTSSEKQLELQTRRCGADASLKPFSHEELLREVEWPLEP
ncbi:hypothetical protein Mrose_01653 [Calidithermus roseus]|uniref:Uncharacterized protein n=1 Tax=Calidithermus roseus TaxID=1644118 RepID=A0A399ESX7_9DEIN|nr:hypothetical protein Mrose_01653 [Calidithermus roseus]